MEDLIKRVARAIEANKPMSDWPTVEEVERQAQAVLDELRDPVTSMFRVAMSPSPLLATTAEGYWKALVSISQKDDEE